MIIWWHELHSLPSECHAQIITSIAYMDDEWNEIFVFTMKLLYVKWYIFFLAWWLGRRLQLLRLVFLESQRDVTQFIFIRSGIHGCVYCSWLFSSFTRLSLLRLKVLFIELLNKALINKYNALILLSSYIARRWLHSLTFHLSK